MSDLNARIRAIRVVLDKAAAIPERPPKEWLQVCISGSVLSFVDTNYSEEQLGDRIRSVLGPVKRIEALPMPLREVFTALARAARDGVN